MFRRREGEIEVFLEFLPLGSGGGQQREPGEGSLRIHVPMIGPAWSRWQAESNASGAYRSAQRSQRLFGKLIT